MDRRLPVRRLLTDTVSYLSNLAAAVRDGWSRFFFRPADPTALGLIRIVVGLLAFWSLFVLGLDLHAYLGSQGWADAETTHQALPPFAWSLWFYVPDSMLRLVWIACLAVFGLFTVGLFSRTTAVLAWVVVVSTVRRAPYSVFGFDQILSLLTLYLAACGASGQAVSLDRFVRRYRQARAAASALGRTGVGRRVAPLDPGVPRPTISANLSLRLIQLHLVFMYGMAGLAKLQGPSWWNGMAIWGTMTAGEFASLDFTGLAAWPKVLNFLTHGSLALELLYPILIWPALTRPLMIVGAVALHLGIAIVSPGLTEFGLAMIAANVAFVSGRWLRSLSTGEADDQPALRVLFDGACPRCRASMALITAADPDHVVEPIDLTAVDVGTVDPRLTRDACMRAMHVVSRTGRLTAGFDAVATIGRRLPLFRPLAILGSLPGVVHLGRIVYNRIATSRPRDVPCTDDVCGVPSPVSSAASNIPRSRSGSALDHQDATRPDSQTVKHP
jgi:predicted DCC family thiol-disulfide oxidoreductase YuxK